MAFFRFLTSNDPAGTLHSCFAVACILAPTCGRWSTGRRLKHTHVLFAQQAEFANQMLKLKEMRTQKEEELEGGWYTEERMEKDLGYSKFLAVPKICCLLGFWVQC